MVFEPPSVEEELLELRRVRRAQVRQAHRLLDVSHYLVPNSLHNCMKMNRQFQIDVVPPPDIVRLDDAPVVVVALGAAAAVALPREAAPRQEVEEHVSQGLQMKVLC